MLKELPNDRKAKSVNPTHANFKPNLREATRLYIEARREALRLVYVSKDISQARSMLVAADFEEAAASCGHFGSSLQDFAENCLTYLDVLDEVELEIHERPYGRTWGWLAFWKRQQKQADVEEPIGTFEKNIQTRH